MQADPQIRIGSGAIITTTAVLTVAQNVRGFQAWRVGAGALTIQGLHFINVATAVEHPQYDPSTLTNNLAVLRLVTAFPGTSNFIFF